MERAPHCTSAIANYVRKSKERGTTGCLSVSGTLAQAPQLADLSWRLQVWAAQCQSFIRFVPSLPRCPPPPPPPTNTYFSHTYSQGSNLTTHTHRSLRPASGLVRARRGRGRGREVHFQSAANGPMPTSPVSLVGVKSASRESPAEVENAEGCN